MSGKTVSVLILTVKSSSHCVLLSLEQQFGSWHQNGSNCVCCAAEAQYSLGGLSISFWEGSFPYQSQILGVLAEHKTVLQHVRIFLFSLAQLEVQG